MGWTNILFCFNLLSLTNQEYFIQNTLMLHGVALQKVETEKLLENKFIQLFKRGSASSLAVSRFITYICWKHLPIASNIEIYDWFLLIHGV